MNTFTRYHAEQVTEEVLTADDYQEKLVGYRTRATVWKRIKPRSTGRGSLRMMANVQLIKGQHWMTLHDEDALLRNSGATPAEALQKEREEIDANVARLQAKIDKLQDEKLLVRAAEASAQIQGAA